MSDVSDKSGRVTVAGSLLGIDEFVSPKKGTIILTLRVSDFTNTLLVKIFPEEMEKAKLLNALNDIKEKGDEVVIKGFYKFDEYAHDYCLYANHINRREVKKRMDEAPEKRVELHLHTQMSAMDATTDVEKVIARAAQWGHKAIAVTDHGVVHSFPKAKAAARKNNIKLIFGCEGYLVPDCELIPFQQQYCALAVTGTGSGELGRVYEIAAVRFNENGETVDSFYTPANPGVPLPKDIAEYTGLTNEETDEAPRTTAAIKAVSDFIGNDVIIVNDEAHLKLLTGNQIMKDAVSRRCVSTAMLAHYLRREKKKTGAEFPDMPAKEYADKIKQLFCELLTEQKERNVNMLPLIDCSVKERKKLKSYHIILLAETQPGLKNLYKLVSYSNLDHFYKKPKIPKSLLNIYREGIILGSACEAGELFRAMVAGKPEEELLKIASWYDYLEIQPVGNNAFMIREGIAKDVEALRDYNRHIVEIGEKLGKPVAATGDVHFLDPEDSIFRAVIMSSEGFKDAIDQPPLYFKTTEEMLEEFSYLGEEKAFEVVVETPNMIADRCDELRPFLDDKKTYSPELPNAAEELKSLAVNKAHELYGDVLPEIVQKRLDRELTSIIGNGYSSLYMVAQKLVSKSLGDGYLVGSRGSVGSSLVAYLAGITEVNALPAHYRCPNCKYSEFPPTDGKSECGMDLPEKNCPICGTPLRRDGYKIPFETFLGFKGDKTPDIDLNFSGEYQPVAHKFTETMFGEGHAFRAGTIADIQEKTAYGFVMHYAEEYGLNFSEAEKERLAQGCVGTRRTTGQHPGGIVVVPQDLEIYDFCPVQHPAEKEDAESITTHFDFHALDDKLVKLDILGHDDPTTLRMLQDMTGIDPKTIPLSDKDTMSIFKSEKVLGISLDKLGCDVGCLGIPEFGTSFVRGMLMDTRPTTMEELVRISGLSHGTNVWLNNAETLINDGVANLMQVICTRDDIMNYLIACGGEPSLSFKTMESVRKGRGLKPEMEEAMKKNNVPDWYIESCKKIKYMFPRAHAAAYVMMAFRIAYFKVHYPLAFYTAYLTIKSGKFDVSKCLGGAEKVLANIREIKRKAKPDPKDEDQLTVSEVIYEMNLRGIELLPIDIYKSKATKFVIEGDKIRTPFSALPGLGNNAAELIEKAAAEGEFISREDFSARTKANSSVVSKLAAMGCLDDFPETNQVSMF